MSARTLAEMTEIVYRLHGCSCEDHPSNGVSASCSAWRRQTAEKIARALLPVKDGGMALHVCLGCDALLPVNQIRCAPCAARVVAAGQANQQDG